MQDCFKEEANPLEQVLTFSENLRAFLEKIKILEDLEKEANILFDSEGETSKVIELRSKVIRYSLDLLEALNFKTVNGMEIYMTDDRKQVHSKNNEHPYEDVVNTTNPDCLLLYDVFNTAWIKSKEDGVWYPYFNKNLSKGPYNLIYKDSWLEVLL